MMKTILWFFAGAAILGLTVLLWANWYYKPTIERATTIVPRLDGQK